MGFLRISKESHYLLDYYYYVDLNSTNIFTIGNIINSFCATVFLYLALQNNRKYENISIYFEVKSTKKLLHQNFQLLYQ